MSSGGCLRDSRESRVQFAYQQHRLIGSFGLVAFVVVMSTGRWCRGIRHHLVLLRTIRSLIVITRRKTAVISREHFRNGERGTRDPSRTGSHSRAFTHGLDDRVPRTDIVAAKCTSRAFPPRDPLFFVPRAGYFYAINLASFKAG